MKTKNLAHLSVSADQLGSILSAVTALENNTSNFVALPPGQKQQSRSIGPRSEQFCRRGLALMQRHPQLLPPKIPLNETLVDLKAYDELRPVLERLTALLARMVDSQFALGSNIYAVALEGYNQLRRLGETDGLKQACDELGILFARNTTRAKARQKPTVAEPPVPAPVS